MNIFVGQFYETSRVWAKQLKEYSNDSIDTSFVSNRIVFFLS